GRRRCDTPARPVFGRPAPSRFPPQVRNTSSVCTIATRAILNIAYIVVCECQGLREPPPKGLWRAAPPDVEASRTVLSGAVARLQAEEEAVAPLGGDFGPPPL